MRRSVDHAALSAAGYFDELGVEPGTEARFHLSSRDPEPRLRVVRLDRAAGSESAAWPLAKSGAALVVQSLDLGSWLTILPQRGLLDSALWTLDVEFRLSTSPGGRTLLAGEGVAVRFARDG